uniref:Uncharacterized protein n=1 Tax=Glossina palpalis gambiensis TaxID=67801 RepID=A0A1B0C4V3_9MUSC
MIIYIAVKIAITVEKVVIPIVEITEMGITILEIRILAISSQKCNKTSRLATPCPCKMFNTEKINSLNHEALLLMQLTKVIDNIGFSYLKLSSEDDAITRSLKKVRSDYCDIAEVFRYSENPPQAENSFWLRQECRKFLNICQTASSDASSTIKAIMFDFALKLASGIVRKHKQMTEI